MIVVKEMTKETVRAAVRKAAQMPRKMNFTPSRAPSVLVAAVVTLDVSPNIPVQTAATAGLAPIKSKLEGFVEV